MTAPLQSNAAATVARRRPSCATCRAVFREGFDHCPGDGQPLAIVDGDPLIGMVVGERYRIEALIGEGGVGRVYAARHVRMSRRFAIKVPFGDLAHDPKMKRRFLREADAAGKLAHPNVGAVLDVGETERGLVYMALDLVEGISLSTLLHREGRLPTARAISLFRQIVEGLAHAHDRGLIHRDLKPDNIVVERGVRGEVARIIDFGIAIPTDLDERGRLTTEGIVVGTPYYMAPEQATGAALDARTDLFALGLILYEMLAGVPPFGGPAFDVLRKHISERPPPIGERAPGTVVDVALEALVFRLLEKDPAQRPASAREVLAALDAVASTTRAASSPAVEAEDRRTAVRPSSVVGTARAEPSSRRRRVVLALCGSILLALAAIAWSCERGATVAAPPEPPRAVVELPVIVERAAVPRPPAVRDEPTVADATPASPRRPGRAAAHASRPTSQERSETDRARPSFTARYAEVGRQLERLARRGVDVSDLVREYRAIPYLVAVRDASRRAEASRALDAIDAAIARLR